MVQPSSLKSQQQPGQLPWAGQEEGMQAGGRGIVRRIESKIKSNENKKTGRGENDTQRVKAPRRPSSHPQPKFYSTDPIESNRTRRE